MSLSNPFGKMKIERDSDDEEDDFQKVKSNKPSQQLFVSQETKKKKKRPENTENQGPKIEEEEGFEEVSKHKPQRKKQKGEEGDDFNPSKQNHYIQKEGPKYYPPKNKKPGKREFERKSGTGRGKEVSKGGAGGKGTWGDNPKEISRKYEKNYDEYFIDRALNSRKEKDDDKEEKDIKENEEKNDKDVNEGDDDKNEKNEKNEKNDKNENEDVKESEHDNKKDNKKDKKKGFEKEVKKEDLLNRPENAMSLDDYLKQQNVDNKEEEDVKVERPKDSENLTVLKVEKSNEIGVSESKKKKGKKHKEKKVDNEDFSNVFDNLKIGEGGRGNEYHAKEKKGKFKFDPNDFPKI